MPHLRELVEHHKDDPFALIGINTGDDPKAYREGVEKFGVTWLSAYQGERQSPISNLFKVRGYPTYVLIGPDGKIIETGHNGKAFDATIGDLVAEMKSE